MFGDLGVCFLFAFYADDTSSVFCWDQHLACTVGLATSQDKKRNHSLAETLLNRFPEKYEELMIAHSLEARS